MAKQSLSSILWKQILLKKGFNSMRLAEMEGIMLNIGLFIFAAFVFFIIYDLAKRSKAGKFGTIILFLALGLGLAAFIVKTIIVEMIGI
jgi:hypothetical protein